MSKVRHLILSKAYDKRGRQLSCSFNSYEKSNPLMKYFSQRAGLSEEKVFLHSELSSLIKARGKQVHTLTVERYLKDGSMALAKPCPACSEAIKAFGVVKVLYTTEDGWKGYMV